MTFYVESLEDNCRAALELGLAEDEALLLSLLSGLEVSKDRFLLTRFGYDRINTRAKSYEINSNLHLSM